MINEKILKENCTEENFKEFVLGIEQENLKTISKEDKKQMVAKIVRIYEEVLKNDNK